MQHSPLCAHVPNELRVEFKKLTDESYRNYREIMQLLDVATLDFESLHYNPRALIAAFLYIVIGKNM
jgi:hypothetical protein